VTANDLQTEGTEGSIGYGDPADLTFQKMPLHRSQPSSAISHQTKLKIPSSKHNFF
jgi:hypothetical protein